MKVLLLIISSPGEAYDIFKETWKTYMHLHGDMDSFFIELRPDAPEYGLLEGATILFQGEECIIPGCLRKTILALRKYRDQYDFVVRTNLSSIIDLPRLYDYLQESPNRTCYAGYHGYYGSIQFCSGALFVMSRDIASYVADNADIASTLPDDVYIGGLIMNRYGVIYRLLNRHDYSAGNVDIQAPACFHYRFKSEDRMEDTEMHKKYATLVNARI